MGVILRVFCEDFKGENYSTGKRHFFLLSFMRMKWMGAIRGHKLFESESHPERLRRLLRLVHMPRESHQRVKDNKQTTVFFTIQNSFIVYSRGGGGGKPLSVPKTSNANAPF